MQTCAHEELFGLRVGRQLSRIHNHCSPHGRHSSSPQSKDTFLLHNPRQRISNILVIPALCLRQSAISSHPD